jgi:hypothetical protein
MTKEEMERPTPMKTEQAWITYTLSVRMFSFTKELRIKCMVMLAADNFRILSRYLRSK